MSYNIIEAKIEYNNSKIHRITVLVEFSENDIRAIQASTKPRGGYMNIGLSAELNGELLQEVAGYGMEVKISKYFPQTTQKV